MVGESIVFPITLIALLFVFGGLVAASLPLVVAMITVGGSPFPSDETKRPRAVRYSPNGPRPGREGQIPPVDSRPPSTRTVSPVIHAASSETRKPISCATSSGVPSRFNGYTRAAASSSAE